MTRQPQTTIIARASGVSLRGSETSGAGIFMPGRGPTGPARQQEDDDHDYRSISVSTMRRPLRPRAGGMPSMSLIAAYV